MAGLASRRFSTFKAPGFTNYGAGGGGSNTQTPTDMAAPAPLAPVAPGTSLSAQTFGGSGDNAGRDGPAPPDDGFTYDGVSSSRPGSKYSPTLPSLVRAGALMMGGPVGTAVGLYNAKSNIDNTDLNLDVARAAGLSPALGQRVGGYFGVNNYNKDSATEFLNSKMASKGDTSLRDANARNMSFTDEGNLQPSAAPATNADGSVRDSASPESSRGYNFTGVADPATAAAPAAPTDYTSPNEGRGVEATSLDGGAPGAGGAPGGFGAADVPGADYGGAGPGYLADGGYVDGAIMPGDPPGPDNRIIAGTKGEFMLRPEATEALGPDMLRKLNSGKITGPMLAKALSNLSSKRQVAR